MSALLAVLAAAATMLAALAAGHLASHIITRGNRK